MYTTLKDDEIKSELDSTDRPEKIPAFSGRRYPIEYLNPREFEILLYLVYKHDIGKGILSDKFDSVQLLTGTNDRGRDIILLKKKKNVGLIQCKRYADPIQKPQLVREIIKFILHALQDESLISDIKDFTYYFVALNGLNDKATTLINDFNNIIRNEPHLKSWTTEVINENETIRFKTYDEVSDKLIDHLIKIKIEPVNGTDIDQKLKNAKEIVPVFFEIEKVANQEMLDDIFAKYVGFKNDEDLERLRKKIQDLPKEKRMSLGLYSVFGYSEDFYKIISHDRKVVSLIADIKGYVNELYIKYLQETIEKYQILFIAGLPQISPFTKQAIVPYLFIKYSLQFQKIEFGNLFSSILTGKTVTPRPDDQILKEIKEELVRTGELVLKNDFSTFVGDDELINLKKELTFHVHRGFTSTKEMSQRFDADMIILKPYIEKIESYLKQMMPQNPTIIIENSNFLDVEEDIKKIVNEAIRLDKK